MMNQVVNFLVHPFVTGWNNFSTAVWGKEKKDLAERVLLAALGVFEMAVPIVGHVIAALENPINKPPLKELAQEKRVEVVKKEELATAEPLVAPEATSANSTSAASQAIKKEWLKTTAKVALIFLSISAAAAAIVAYAEHLPLPANVVAALKSVQGQGNEVIHHMKIVAASQITSASSYLNPFLSFAKKEGHSLLNSFSTWSPSFHSNQASAGDQSNLLGSLSKFGHNVKENFFSTCSSIGSFMPSVSLPDTSAWTWPSMPSLTLPDLFSSSTSEASKIIPEPSVSSTSVNEGVSANTKLPTPQVSVAPALFSETSTQTR